MCGVFVAFAHMSYSLNSLNGAISGEYIGEDYRGYSEGY